MFDQLGATDHVVHGDAADVAPLLDDASFQVVYIDPPFNTGTRQQRTTVSTRHAGEGEDGDRTGFAGRRYATTELARLGYLDAYEDYLGFIAPHLEAVHRLLSEDGTLYFHIDQREAHYCKVLLDQIFGRDQFLNEVIWAYDYGGRGKRSWPRKHDTILVYVKDLDAHHFDQDAIERIPYMAPGLVTADKAARGKLPTDVWWHTIVSTNGSEKTGYPNQKPVGVVSRALQASSSPGGRVLDLFAGSGTTGAAARALGRQFVMVDSNPDAIEVMRARLGDDRITYSAVE